MRNPLFSTYRGGENRVTSSTLAVFERIDLDLVRELLAAAAETGDELETVTFENQVDRGAAVPDGAISGKFQWYFETKTVPRAYESAVAKDQVRRHAHLLEDDENAWLFVLTPDPVKPAWFDVLDEVSRPQHVKWIGFAPLRDAIQEVVADPTRVIGEQARFLLAELISLYESDGLLDSDDTVVVAASTAWPEYAELSAYVCQPERSFRVGLTHFGFYTRGEIKPLVARIHGWYPSVEFSAESADGYRAKGNERLASLIETCLRDTPRSDRFYGVMLLSGPEDADTLKLRRSVKNDTLARSGRPFAWTQGQRYVALEHLRREPEFTSQLGR